MAVRRFNFDTLNSFSYLTIINSRNKIPYEFKPQLLILNLTMITENNSADTWPWSSNFDIN